ncbi:autotransporter outer membrane beta-barrel domain-containing protein, partial [Pararobbsia silviterrae]|uniref:autotransporter outer membrane beta-barrel domain-containing protein n=1 Tax=Pararobbsia silviterrae TaxID=1792498 RepID=UPI001314D359
MEVSTSSVGTLSNSGTISGYNAGVYNNGGTINVLTNGGTMAATATNTGAGVVNSGNIGQLTNSGTISGNAGIDNRGGVITVLNNSGTISPSYSAIFNTGSIGQLTNSGKILGDWGIINYSEGVITSLVNSVGGTISPLETGIQNYGRISTITNAGEIIASAAIWNTGTGAIGAINNSGTIRGTEYAILNFPSASIGTITNSGAIIGTIKNENADVVLTFAGGTGSVFGTLTGYNGAIGTITSNADVTFASGNLVLNDNVNVAQDIVYTVNNTGATLQVNNPITISGNYNQAGGTLVIGVGDGATHTGNESDTGYGRLIVNGNVTLAAGTGVELKSTTGNYAFAAGQRFVVIESTGINVNYNESALNYSIAGYTSSITGLSMTVDNGELVDTDLVLQINSATATASSSPTGTPNATVPNAIQSLGGLSHYAGVSNAGLLNLFDAADALEATGTTAQLNKAGAQLSPIQQANSSQAAAAPTIDVLNVVADHVQSLRLAQADGNDSGESSGISTGESLAGWGVWGQAFGGHASQGQRGDTPGYNANYGGLLLGADKAIDDHWRVGGVFNYSNTQINDTDDTEGDSTEVNAYGLLGYASYTGQPWYVNVSGGV